MAEQSAPTSAAPADDAAAVVAGAVKVLRAYKMDAIADIAESKLSDTEAATVVVVGEVQRGKSSLVNALVGQRGICPVGVDVTSSATVSVTADPELECAERATLFFPSGPRDCPVAQLPDWVTTGGARVVDPQVEELPTSAAVAIRTSMLAGVTVIDTPGVGGLDAGLTRLASRSAQQACVLVVACDASSPLTAPEIAFVRQAASTVDAVVVAVTKIDKHLRRWREIVADNQRIIAEQLQRPVPVIGVSSLYAAWAVETTDPAERAELDADSGISVLRAAITTRLQVGARAPHLDAVRTCVEGLRTVRGTVAAELDALEVRAAGLPDLTAQRDRLSELQDQSRQWEQYLARDLTLLRQSAVDDLEQRLDAVRDKWTHYINTHGMAVLRSSAQKFTADMQADLQVAMAETLAGFLQRLHDSVIESRFADDPAVWEELCARIVDSMQDKKIETHQVGNKRHGLLDPTLLTMGVVGSSTLGGLLGLSALMGVGLIVGTAWVGVNLSFRAIRAGKTNLLSWLRETIGATKSATGRLLDAAVAQARPEIVIRYRDYLRTNIDTLQKTIAEVQQNAAADEATRTKTHSRLTTNLGIVDKRLAAATALLAASEPPSRPAAATAGADMGGAVR
ncbi:dynamin family protein [Gordonia aquimaris]|uniref:Dynamin family protein n=1 Tax=Gordonia aquimaris TaxID=2984863 RepID=A0A9X3D974_9ACTN|nr:dynamin family protein [Gordonia aquimaris]MCX2967193.1 dynamin family protein [Gordonia aquimaris]